VPGRIVGSLTGAGPTASLASSVSEELPVLSWQGELAAEAGVAGRPSFWVLPEDHHRPLPSLAAGPAVTVLYRLRPLGTESFFTRRVSMGLGFSAARYTGAGGTTDQAWRVGVPIDFRFDLLTGAVRPWLGYRPSYDLLRSVTQGQRTNEFRFGMTYGVGVEVQPTQKLTLGVRGGYRLVDFPLAGGADDGARWFEVGAGASWRFDT
jgi:hypothetical protein